MTRRKKRHNHTHVNPLHCDAPSGTAQFLSADDVRAFLLQHDQSRALGPIAPPAQGRNATKDTNER